MPDLITFIITTVLSLVITGLILLRNAKDGLNQALAFFTTSLVAWSTFNYLADNSSLHSLFTRLTFSSMAIVGIAVVVFSSYFPTKHWMISRRTMLLYSIIAVLVGVLSLTPLLVTSTINSADGLVINTGIFYYPYLAYILGTVIFSVRNFAAQRKRATAVERSQLNLVVNGFLILAFFGVLSQLILPAIINSWSVSKYGPVFIMVFIAYISVAIVKHKLFDIRTFVFRAAVYLLSVTVLGGLYSALVYGVGGIFIDIDNVSYLQRVFFAALALLIAITYAPIIKFFNRFTSQLFYRDAYDTQDVIDQIGKIIVGSIDLHKIQKSSLSVLLSALRPSYGGFILKSSGGQVSVQDFVGESPKFNSEDLSLLIKRVGKMEVIYDELNQGSSDIAQRMRTNDISLIVPLITKNETIGYFITGPKKSGKIFNQQDKSMVKIVANELAVALQNSQRFEEIQAFNITLQEKVNEATRELKKTNRKLIALDEAKDEFISMASHQLRTPLTSIKGYLSMLSEGDLGKLTSAQQKAIKEAFGSSQRMVFLIADFLNVSRIKTGKFVIELREVDLPQIVSEELSQLKEMAGSREITLVYDQPGVFPNLKLDDNKIRQVMMNMVDNAIYYTPAGGKVAIQLFVDGSDVVFKVTDTGIGVPKREQHKMFTKFFRAGNAKKARPDGTGLGLFMAQKIIVEQGGSVIFESTEGKGSTFGFRFPLSKIKA